jgi:hypothetical protein
VLNGYVTNPNATLTLTELIKKSKKKRLYKIDRAVCWMKKVLTDSTLQHLCKQKPIKIHRSKVRIYAYAAQSPLPMLGVFEETIESKTKMTIAKFHVAKGDNGNLLCSETAAELGLITLKIHSVNKDKPEVNITVKVPNEFTPEAQATEFIQSLTNEYQDLFRGIWVPEKLRT